MKSLAEYLNICKTHWKEIFAISFLMHFVFDIFIFYVGYIIGKLT